MSWIDLLKIIILATWLHILVAAQVSNYMKLRYGRVWGKKGKAEQHPMSDVSVKHYPEGQ